MSNINVLCKFISKWFLLFYIKRFFFYAVLYICLGGFLGGHKHSIGHMVPKIHLKCKIFREYQSYERAGVQKCTQRQHRQQSHEQNFYNVLDSFI